jgi:hypothetical protein
MFTHTTGLVVLFSLCTVGAAQTLTKIPVQNFTQMLNHGGNDTRTFNQAYQVDTTWFRPGGAILFQQGDEHVQSIGVTNQIHALSAVEQAPILGAMIVQIEHRFFGTSFPEDFDENDPASYEPLTLDNILQDAVSVVKHIKETVPGALDSKVIVSGGEYFSRREWPRYSVTNIV